MAIGPRIGLAIGAAAGVACGPGADELGGAPAPAKRLVIIAGQSNALGLGVADDASNYEGIADAYSAVQYIEKSGTLSDPPVFVTDGPRDLAPRTKTVAGQVAGTFGVELSMGRYLAENSSDTWFVAKMAIDSSSLEDEWLNASYPSTPPALYDQFETFISDQLTAFDAELAAIVWIQGETDANEADAANYLTNLNTFVGGLRSTFGADFKFVLNRLSSNYSAGSLNVVRSHQHAYVAANEDDAGIVFADDLPFRDGAHFTDDAYVTLGLRFGAEILRSIAGSVPAAPRIVGIGAPVFASSVQSASPTWPPGHQSGDRAYMILGGLGANAYTLSAAEGFSQVADSPQKDGGSALNARLQVWECVATGSSMATPTIADAASDDAKMALIVVVRGSSGIDVTSGDAIGSGDTAVSVPGDTTTGPNRTILSIVAHRIDSASPQVSAWENADLADVTEHVDIATTTGVGVGIGVATGVKAAAGDYGATTATLAASSTQARLSIALKP